MTASPPCYRHSRGTWIAGCAGCTAWHLADELGRRAPMVALPTPAATAAPPSSGRRLSLVPPAALPRAA
jgi:hypothetical protein